MDIDPQKLWNATGYFVWMIYLYRECICIAALAYFSGERYVWVGQQRECGSELCAKCVYCTLASSDYSFLPFSSYRAFRCGGAAYTKPNAHSHTVQIYLSGRRSCGAAHGRNSYILIRMWGVCNIYIQTYKLSHPPNMSIIIIIMWTCSAQYFYASISAVWKHIIIYLYTIFW